MRVFKETLAEYLMLLIASELKVGPKMEKKMGFDIIIYQDCI
jgi:hypothetical protein